MSRTIALTKNKVTIVDDEDFERVNKHKWCASDAGKGIFYGHRKDNRKTVLLHRFIMGIDDPDIHIDHKNNDSLDNRKVNLRQCTQQNNNRNKSSHKNSSSKYLGVSFDKFRCKWKANIYLNQKNLFIGRFSIEEDAAIAYDNIAKREFGEFANLNFK